MKILCNEYIRMDVPKPKSDSTQTNANGKTHDKNPPQKPKILQPSLPDNVSKQIDEVMRRIRLLEERYSGLRKKTQFTEQNMLKDAKELFEENKALHEAISDITNQVSDLGEKLVKLTDEVKATVSKAQFNVVAKYVDYWQPMDFVTRKQAMELIDAHKSKIQNEKSNETTTSKIDDLVNLDK